MISVVFFDIGNTIADPILNQNGDFIGLKPYPLISETLQRLNTNKVRCGLITTTPAAETVASLSLKLKQAGLLLMLDSSLFLLTSVEGLTKKDKSIFLLAAQRANQPSSHCVYVSESESERAVAQTAGLTVSFHPLHLLGLVQKE